MSKKGKEKRNIDGAGSSEWQDVPKASLCAVTSSASCCILSGGETEGAFGRVAGGGGVPSVHQASHTNVRSSEMIC